MSRFTGRDVPGEFTSATEDDDLVTVQVKAVLTMNIWIESLQMNNASTVLITDSDSDGGAEVLTGVDGVTGCPLQITIKKL